jgi:hypothetical protein
MPVFWGLNVGKAAAGDSNSNVGAAATGTSSTGRDIEVVINNNANVPNVNELLVQLEKLRNFILQTGKNW